MTDRPGCHLVSVAVTNCKDGDSLFSNVTYVIRTVVIVRKGLSCVCCVGVQRAIDDIGDSSFSILSQAGCWKMNGGVVSHYKF